jgi:hypothetical protein
LRLDPIHLDPSVVADFRKHLRGAVEQEDAGWSESRRLVAPELACDTIQRLRRALASASLDAALRDSLLSALLPGETAGLKGISGDALRSITGLNPTKAVRNLCVLLDIKPLTFASSYGGEAEEAAVSGMSQEQIEGLVRGKANPFDVLLDADVASLVDFGAGDLAFEEQIVDRYLGPLEQINKALTLHCLDRLDPGEGASNLVKVGHERLHSLQNHPSPRLHFRFFAKQDMFALHKLGDAYPRYTIAVCHSPASPTFAYEPSRLSSEAVQQRLRETKGEFRRARQRNREVLEVRHGDEWLIFPPWKFEVYGPLALLDLLSRTGKVCVMGAVDMEVFLEILSQLLPDESARPRELFFTEQNAADYFGKTWHRLSALAVGESTSLQEVRQNIPRVLGPWPEGGESYGFRFVEVRRGALFPGVPSGTTASIFEKMTREAAPWFLTLVPAV